MGLLDEARAKKQGKQQAPSLLEEARLRRQQSEITPTANAETQPVSETVMPGALNELATGATRGILGIVDTLGPDRFNDLMTIVGRDDLRVPPLASYVPERGAYDSSLTGRIAGGVGEALPAAAGVGALIRTGAAMLPSQTGTTGNVIKAMASSTAAQDLGYGALGAAGSETGREYGGETGAMVGGVAAPLAAPLVGSAAKAALGAIKTGFDNFIKTGSPFAAQTVAEKVMGLTDQAAIEAINRELVREGISPDEFLKRIEKLGPDAIPADAGDNLRRLLRTAINVSPNVSAEARNVLTPRAYAQGGRLAKATDKYLDTVGLDVDTEIQRIADAGIPESNRLYDIARNASIGKYETPPGKPGQFRIGATGSVVQNPTSKTFVEKVIGQIDSPNAADGLLPKEVVSNAKREIAAKIANDEVVTPFDKVDAAKRYYDDLIENTLRKGSDNLARHYVQLKNKFITEADKAFPGYAEARKSYADRMGLEKAASIGEQYFRMKPRDVKYMAQTMSDPEIKMMKLGMKRAILDKIDKAQEGSDVRRQLFGPHGEMAKLRPLFKSGQEFADFKRALKTEVEYTTTRATAIGNSTTVQQAGDLARTQQSIMGDGSDLGVAREMMTQLVRFDPKSILEKAGQGLISKAKAERLDRFNAVMERTGNLLLAQGADRAKVANLLKTQNKKEMQRLLNLQIRKMKTNAPKAVQGLVATETTQED